MDDQNRYLRRDPRSRPQPQPYVHQHQPGHAGNVANDQAYQSQAQLPQQAQPQQQLHQQSHNAYQQQPQQNDGSATSNDGLLPNWQQLMDHSTGHHYYYNSVTKETRWDPPKIRLPQIPPPPPPPPPIPTATTFTMRDNQQRMHITSHSGNKTTPFNQYPSSTMQQHTTMPVMTRPSSTSTTTALSTAPPSLVQKARNACNRLAANPSIQMELESLTVGEMVDLCYLQNTTTEWYEPIRPFEMTTRMNRPPIEPARLDQRMLQLEQQLAVQMKDAASS